MEDQKRRQVEYHETEIYPPGTPREADNSNPLVAWLNNYRIRKTIDIIGAPLSGKRILSVCGGDGEEADFLSCHGAEVTVIDISDSAIASARNRNPGLCCIQMDAESLAFPDSSFDWALVREGLHHLARPAKALYELERVSREGFAIMEGQDSLLVRALAILGIAKSWDPAGGYIYRFSRREIQKIFSCVQTLDRWRIHTTWLPYGSDILKYFPAFKRVVWPVINCPLVLRFLISRLGKLILKAIFNVMSFLIGRWGNCLIVVAWKRPLASSIKVK
jgi:ubiquinone/menaquinone biosynthesis C-methylase UbiE